MKPQGNKDGNIYKFEVANESTKLPATVKLEVKVVKSANYEAYKTSKEKFDLMMFEPTFTTSCMLIISSATPLRALTVTVLHALLIWKKSGKS